MIYRFQNIYGISYVFAGDSQDIKNKIQELLLKIIEDKKSPFADIYVKFPIFLLPKFNEELRNSDMKYKEMEIRKEMVMFKF